MARRSTLDAGPECAFASHAEFYFLEAVGIAAFAHNLNGVIGQRWIDATELLDEIRRCHQYRLLGGTEDAWDFDVLEGDPRRLEVGRSVEAGTGAVLLELVDDQATAWHDVHHRIDDRRWHVGLAFDPAELRPAAFVLRP